MSSPIIFDRDLANAAIMRAGRFTFGGNQDIVTGAIDPTSVATEGPKGSLFMSRTTGKIYVKQDGGSTSNWLPVAFLADLGGMTYRAESTSVTAALNDFLVVDASGGARTITLPAAGTAGAKIVVKKVDVSANIVTVDGNAAETIDGIADVKLVNQYDAVTLVDNGTNWDVEGNLIAEELIEDIRAEGGYPIAFDTWGDLGSITLGVGEWDIVAQADHRAVAAISTTSLFLGIGTAAGTSTAGLVTGDTRVATVANTSSGSHTSLSVFQSGLVLTASTTLYLKGFAGTSITSLNVSSKISARRVK